MFSDHSPKSYELVLEAFSQARKARHELRLILAPRHTERLNDLWAANEAAWKIWR